MEIFKLNKLIAENLHQDFETLYNLPFYEYIFILEIMKEDAEKQKKKQGEYTNNQNMNQMTKQASKNMPNMRDVKLPKMPSLPSGLK